ncbi:MAG TPA: hypothetical protein VFM18_18305 [Methanosarcina sp.]|nr:hypothetical protein [Methanosarcina sp.]
MGIILTPADTTGTYNAVWYILSEKWQKEWIQHSEGRGIMDMAPVLLTKFGAKFVNDKHTPAWEKTKVGPSIEFSNEEDLILFLLQG